MITEDHVSFEIAKLLKEKGFDIKCQCCYTQKGYIRNLLTDANNTNIQDFNSLTKFEYEGVGLKGWYGSISAPTLQMALKWLRENHKVYIEIHTYFDEEPVEYNAICYKDGIYNDTLYYTTEYKDAVNNAIKYALKNLI